MMTEEEIQKKINEITIRTEKNISELEEISISRDKILQEIEKASEKSQQMSQLMVNAFNVRVEGIDVKISVCRNILTISLAAFIGALGIPDINNVKYILDISITLFVLTLLAIIWLMAEREVIESKLKDVHTVAINFALSEHQVTIDYMEKSLDKLKIRTDDIGKKLKIDGEELQKLI